MISDFNSFTGPTEFDCDVCIIGAGAAGVTLARQLSSSKLNVLLLESGGSDFEPDVQELAIGESSGFSYYELEHARLRFFGGTCAIWGGRTAQLDQIDFEQRDWIPHSGWPFEKETLAPYYHRAQELLEIPAVANNQLPGFANPFDEEKLKTAFWQFDEKFDRFALHCNIDLGQKPRVSILMHATVTRLITSENGQAIQTVEIKNHKGMQGVIRARTFVLATGGLEVPRLLLSSKSASHPEGVGNNNDLVGRYFMEHPRARGARIVPKNAKALFKLLPEVTRHHGDRYGMLLRPGETYQEQEALLNTGFTLSVRKNPGETEEAYKRLYNTIRHGISPNKFGRALWKVIRRAAFNIEDSLGTYLRTSQCKKPSYGLYAILRAEQAPNPQSRVKLSEDRDGLGMARINLDWQLSDLDKHSANGAISALDSELRRLDIGHAEPAPWLNGSGKTWEFDPLASSHSIGGYHHMGTARMADSAKQGVTDADGRVHGVENLYIAGSALFPTSGWANPTLTILAMTLRLADKLETTAAT